MALDIQRIYSFSKELLEFRERLIKEIPEMCEPDYDLAMHVLDARSALFSLYKDFDRILLDNDYWRPRLALLQDDEQSPSGLNK